MRPFFIYLILLLLTQSCQNRTPKTVKEVLQEASKDPNLNTSDLKFSFELPAGWKRLDTAMQGVNVTYLLPQVADDFRPAMNVTNANMKGKSPEGYVKSTLQYLNNEMDAEFVAEGELATPGGKVLWYSYNRTFSGIKRENIFYSIPVNGTSYNITAGVISGGMPTYRPVFDSIVKSFGIVRESFTKSDSGLVKWLDSVSPVLK